MSAFDLTDAQQVLVREVHAIARTELVPLAEGPGDLSHERWCHSKHPARLGAANHPGKDLGLRELSACDP